VAITAYELVEGQRVDVPSRDAPPGGTQQGDAPTATGTDAPGATDQPPAGDGQPSASPTDTTLPGAGEAPGDTDDDEPLRDDSEVNAERLNRRFARLTAARRKAERERDALTQQHQVELAQTRGQLEAVQRMLAGAAPELPQTPAQPTGPPQAEQFASHEDYVLAAARYGAQQEFQQRDQQMQERRQQEQQVRFQQDLMTREQAFKAEHPDFDTVVRSGLAGKVSPILQQALMLVPDGPAVAYTLARQPDLVQRLNTLPPPLVLVELGRLSPTPASPGGPAVGSNGNGTVAPPSQATLHAPETPLSGGGAGAPTGQYRDDMSQAEFRAWRKRTSELPEWKHR
jgi:hypothetical protein